MDHMTTVGGEGRPLEDILSRLNDLSRTPRTIDLRQPPPVPAATEAVDEIEIVTDAPATALTTVASAAAAPAPTAAPTEVSAESTIDLTAPPSAPPVPVAAGSETVEAGTEPAPVEEAPVREGARTAVSAPVEHDSRYGRNGAVAPTVVRQAPMPDNVPLLPVSVRQDEAEVAELHAPKSRRLLLALVFLVVVAGAVAALLLVL